MQKGKESKKGESHKEVHSDKGKRKEMFGSIISTAMLALKKKGEGSIMDNE